MEESKVRGAWGNFRLGRTSGACLLLLSLAASRGTARAADVSDCEGLGSALTEHSCFHAELGPFNTVSATRGTNPNGATPNIDAVHTEHRVALAELSGHNVVTYSPLRSGQWIVFLGKDIPLAVYDAEARAVPLIRMDRGTTGCDALPVAHAFELTAGERYAFVLGPSSVRDVVVVVEYVGDFLVLHGRDKDGDGWGDATETLASSVCAAAEGFAERIGDCDDDDPEIHPGAQETCDDVDRNCNGRVDDVGLQCRAGLGACLRTGRVTCEGVAWGEPVACDAVPGEPSAEECNGKDDDCNGLIDDGSNLCSDPEAPTCVRDGDGAFCGCLVDLDCGGQASGRICDASTQACMAGCSNLPGNNGCPDGMVCSEGEDQPYCVAEGEVDPEPEPEPEPAPVGDEPSGCACDLASGPSRGPGAGWVAMGVGVLLMGRRRRRAAALAAVISASACGGKAVSDGDPFEPDPPEEPCVPLLSEAPAQHACSHATHGPFETVVAATDEGDAIPPVDRIHVPYLVELLEGQGWVRYLPAREGLHVFFTGDPVELTVVPQPEPLAPVELTGVKRSDSCSVLGHAEFGFLARRTTYWIHLQKAPGHEDMEPVLLFVEHLGTFGEEAFVRGCE